jgi:hypothetical protein
VEGGGMAGEEEGRGKLGEIRLLQRCAGIRIVKHSLQGSFIQISNIH